MGTKSGASSDEGLKVSKIALFAQEILFQEGDLADCLYLIEDGTVEVFQSSGARTKSLERLGPGEVVGETALIANTFHNRGARALTDISVLRVSSAEIQGALDDSHALIRMLLKHVIRKLERTTDIAFGRPDAADSEMQSKILG